MSGRRVTQKSSNRWDNSLAIASTVIDWSLGDAFYQTLTTNRVFTFSNLQDGQSITVDLTQGASAYTVTWPTTTWTGGTTPEMSTTNGVTTTYHFHRQNGIVYGEAGAVSGVEQDLAFIAACRYLTNN